ncbi:recombinase RecA [Polyangium sorediatum]|uniref:Protein RecA n=2 Tax=Polyangium sorediatum TaxID=889274 RepID=A0ABT6P9V2_9BACT|nr:recombinase RecA [Polyangium sorediatum]MDI1437404.1 recombinase RecA [Polyangium sorediatum]
MMTELLEKMRTVKTVVGSIEKQFGKGAIMSLGDEAETDVRVIGTGAMALDAALGIGGYPRGRIVEIYGPESGGKTTLTLHAMREAQAAGGVAAFIDAEHAFDVSYARAVGVDTERLLVSQPDCGEQALEIAETLTRSGAVDIVVVDSVAALVPKAEIEGDMGDAHMGLQARLMSQALRKLTAIAHRTGTTLVFINQLRQKIGVTFGNPETTTGGNALKFYASIRLDVRRIGPVKVGDEAVGSRTRVKVVKNKLAPPFREAEFDIRWGTGVDAASDLIDYGCQIGIVEKSGAHLSFGGEHLGQGRERARESLLGNERLLAALRAAVIAGSEARVGARGAAEKAA